MMLGEHEHQTIPGCWGEMHLMVDDRPKKKKFFGCIGVSFSRFPIYRLLPDRPGGKQFAFKARMEQRRRRRLSALREGGEKRR